MAREGKSRRGQLARRRPLRSFTAHQARLLLLLLFRARRASLRQRILCTLLDRLSEQRTLSRAPRTQSRVRTRDGLNLHRGFCTSSHNQHGHATIRQPTSKQAARTLARSPRRSRRSPAFVPVSLVSPAGVIIRLCRAPHARDSIISRARTTLCPNRDISHTEDVEVFVIRSRWIITIICLRIINSSIRMTI